jgi:hypothetical protein
MVAWANGKAVVVLGAGATRGAEFVNSPDSHACVPPLNADFFTQLQRVQAENLQPVVDAVVKDVVESFGANFKLTLEEYFTHVEALLMGGALLTPSSKKYSAARLKEKRRNLLDGLSAVLEESADVTKRTSPAVVHRCGYHDALVAALSPPDTIISFNYDCVIDHALRSTDRPVWSAKYGYGFPKPARIDSGTASAWSSPNAPTAQNDTIRLLKLHGSLNWQALPTDDDKPIKFRQRLYKQHGSKTYEIIPPEFLKEVQRQPFETIWARAASALRSAHVLALVGFSFPPTDQLVEALFRMALEDNRSLKRLIIVNPSPDHRWRIRSVCTELLHRRQTRVVQFDTIRDFAPHAERLLR